MSIDRLYSDMFYKPNHIAHLPRDFLSGDDVTLVVNYARHSEVASQLWSMLKCAADRGDNVGVDEFEDQTSVNTLTTSSFIFTVRSVSSRVFCYTSNLFWYRT